jgi:L-aspartate oxidase
MTQSLQDELQVVGMTYLLKTSLHIHQIFATTVVLATGGSGQLFKYTSNPRIATADGVAMAFRAGAILKDMHYIQFHPTALFEKGKSNLFLISEAVRGFGGYVVNSEGKRFLFDYDTRGELATRDIVSAAIFEEINQSRAEFVYLDLRHLAIEDFKNHFPTIYERFISSGFQPEKDLVPIVPVAHYQCGGIEVNEDGQTAVKNLYALGECSCTGLHGTNRLASNSLLEALVYSYNATKKIILENRSIQPKFYSRQPIGIESHQVIHPLILNEFKEQVKTAMTYQVLHGSKEEKMKVLTQLIKIHNDLMECAAYYYRCQNCCELENMLQTAMIIINQSSIALDLETNKINEYAFGD